MPKTAYKIKKINWAIKLMEKDVFTIEDLMKKLKETWPRGMPCETALRQFLRWPKINAEKLDDNGRYRKIIL